MNRITRRGFCLAGLIGVSLLLFYGGKLDAESPEGVQSKPPSISIYDEENLLEITIEDVGKYHGDICPCLLAGFRVTQLAISQLWKDEVPGREDFRIISAFPGQGSQDAFEFITRAKTRGDFTLELPEGTSASSITVDNWVFSFIRKSTDERVRIRLKEEVFPERFFELRKKVKSEPATSEEKEAFGRTKQELKDRLMSLPANKLFGFQANDDEEE